MIVLYLELYFCIFCANEFCKDWILAETCFCKKNAVISFVKMRSLQKSVFLHSFAVISFAVMSFAKIRFVLKLFCKKNIVMSFEKNAILTETFLHFFADRFSKNEFIAKICFYKCQK